jgi:hypothetical protein
VQPAEFSKKRREIQDLCSHRAVLHEHHSARLPMIERASEPRQPMRLEKKRNIGGFLKIIVAALHPDVYSIRPLSAGRSMDSHGTPSSRL